MSTHIIGLDWKLRRGEGGRIIGVSTDEVKLWYL